jgi:hypothetical protein
MIALSVTARQGAAAFDHWYKAERESFGLVWG